MQKKDKKTRKYTAFLPPMYSQSISILLLLQVFAKKFGKSSSKAGTVIPAERGLPEKYVSSSAIHWAGRTEQQVPG